MNSNIGQKIKKYRESLNLNQNDLGERLGISGKTISSWEIGRTEPNMGFVQALSEIFNVSTDKLIYDDAVTPLDIDLIFDDFFPLDYCSNLSAGTPTELLSAEPDSRVYVPIKFQHMKKNLAAFKVNGNSMDNVIPDGSTVVTYKKNDLSEYKQGRVVVALIDGEATVKRMYYDDHQMTLMPDSGDKSHKPLIYNKDISDVYIVGEVVWHSLPDDIADKLY